MMEYFLATIQFKGGFYTKLVLATNSETAKKIATDFGATKHGKNFTGVFISEILKEIV